MVLLGVVDHDQEQKNDHACKKQFLEGTKVQGFKVIRKIEQLNIVI